MVYRAYQGEMDRTVVVKVLTAVDAESTRRRFDRERKAMGRLSHAPGIAPLYGSGFTPSGQPWMLMPFYEQGSLQTVLETRGPLPPAEAQSVGVRIARAVHMAHESGVLHRDLKPANVLVPRVGAPDVADFGIAHLVDETQGVSQALTMTPLYTAPEVFDGVDSGASQDVYSMGALLYALLAGAPAFSDDGQTSVYALMRRVNSEIVPPLPASVPPGLAAVVYAAMNKAPSDRPPSAAALADALEAADLGWGSAPAQAPAEPMPVPERRSVGPMALAAVAVLLLAVGGGLFAAGVFGDDDPAPDPIAEPTTIEGVTTVSDQDPDQDDLDGPGDDATDGDTIGEQGDDPDLTPDTPEPFDPTAAIAAANGSVVTVESFGCTGAHQTRGVVVDGGRIVTDASALRGPWHIAVHHQGTDHPATPLTSDLKTSLALVASDPGALTAARLGEIAAGDRVLFAADESARFEATVVTGPQGLVAELPLVDAVRVLNGAPAFNEVGELVGLATEGDDDVGLFAIADLDRDWNQLPPNHGCPSLVRDLDADDAPTALTQTVRELLYLQRLSNAFADEDWDAVRRYEPAKRNLSDQRFADGWGPLRQGFIYPVERTALPDGRASWRIGLIGHETWDGVDLTTLFCVTWEVDEATGEVVQTDVGTVPVHAPFDDPLGGFVDPADVRGLIAANCPL